MAPTIKEERENESAKLAGTVQEGLYKLALVGGSTDYDEEFKRTVRLYSDSVIYQLDRLNEMIMPLIGLWM